MPFKIIAGTSAAVLIVGVGAWIAFHSSRTMPVPSVVPPPAVAATLHLPLPKEVRGIYISAATAASEKRFTELLDESVKRNVNAVVIDLKNDDGSLAFVPQRESLKADAPAQPTITDLEGVVARAHDAGMYIIARSAVFQDPYYATRYPDQALQRANGTLWRDAKGVAWVDAASTAAWKYNAEIAREAYGRGFDEIQFDYIRFATDGQISAIKYPIRKADESFRSVIGKFFAYLDQELRSEGIPISADLFGLTTWHTSDLGIGQWLADALVHFDHVSPMVYPSHYPKGTLGFANPAEHPYEIVFDSMRRGNEVVAELKKETPDARIGTLRPWLQAFDLGAKYTQALVLAQVRATQENKGSGFLFWNARNVYPNLPKF